ncbi:TIGR03086 family metal-binding protein [Pseudofrankia inefficax]|uniref:Mycothiol-dependent maleylpyruvate isomerase metal-binding domain-containing protein n=1 Tax=Pseudofrankia inefficax (strain DSM 45817 / CECT 9037 / DDB 130130 / EuI1c) TaxID=298654 RepID=E3JD66_PSEI1|nr:TIGR03086 family metal-binding protein [Pseudofrankia inefficax]ADP82350.1 hypothetical protein FraEuI1c_4351 [Pseudofrankia inefficax]
MTFPALDHYRRALRGVDEVVARVEPDRWDSLSPCPPWTARDVLGHLIDGQRQIEALLTGRGPRPPAAEPGALAGAEPAAAWQAARRAIEQVLAAVDPTARTATPLGPRGAADILTLAVIEPLVHAWDLARATGHTVRLDQDAVAAILPGVLALGDQLAATGMYVAARPVPAGTEPQDQLLAATGRTV